MTGQINDTMTLLKQLEACRLEAYQDQAGTWTIGYGHTAGVFKGMKITQIEADQRLAGDTAVVRGGVMRLCSRVPSQQQLMAMTAFAFNIGMGDGKKEGFRTSTVLKCFNAGDDVGAANAFGLWNKIHDPKTGKLKESVGLTHRRAIEKSLYLEGSPKEAPEVLSTQVAVARPIEASSTIAGGKAAIATGGVGAAIAVVNQFQDLLNNAPWLGDVFQFIVQYEPKFVFAAAVAAVGVGIYVIWRKQHDHERGLV